MGFAPGGVKPPVRRNVGLEDDVLALQRDGSNQVQEEGLAGAVATDDEPDRGPSLFHDLKVTKQRLHFIFSSYLNVVETDRGYHARRQRLQNSGTFTG